MSRTRASPDRAIIHQPMTPEQITHLRTHYQSLRGQRRILEASAGKSQLIKEPNLIPLEAEFETLHKKFPGLLPKFNKQQYFSHTGLGYGLFHSAGIIGSVEAALARLESVMEESQSTPVTEYKEFKFIADAKLRKILERDYAEIQRAYISECWKSVIILSGSAIEAIPKGQQEAARSLGLRPVRVLLLIVLPQALRIMVPQLTSQYLNIIKSSTLGAAVAYPEVFQIFAGTVMNQSGKEVETVVIVMAVFLTISLLLSGFMNWYNRRIALVEH